MHTKRMVAVLALLVAFAGAGCQEDKEAQPSQRPERVEPVAAVPTTQAPSPMDDGEFFDLLLEFTWADMSRIDQQLVCNDFNFLPASVFFAEFEVGYGQPLTLRERNSLSSFFLDNC